MTDPTRRFYGQCVVELEDPVLDVGTLVERLLVFDEVVLKSVRLTEIDGLVRAFGFAGTMKLIESRVLEIHAEALATGARASANLPPDTHELVTVRAADRRAVASRWLQGVMRIPGLDYHEARKLKSVVGTHLRQAPDDAGKDTRTGTRIDIDTRPELARLALAIRLAEELGRPVQENDVEVTFEHDGDVYRGRSNVVAQFGMDRSRANELTRGALLAVANLNEQLERMKMFEAIVGFRDVDTQLYERKLGILYRALRTDNMTHLTRVLSACGLPELSEAARTGRLDFDRLLEIRNSDEGREFRDWLSRAGDLSDDDIKKRVVGFGARVARWVNAPTGRILRVVVPALIGAPLDPAVSMATGVGLGLLDQFIWDRLLPRRGPWSVVGERFPSLFED
jgi:hypothetical protein